MTVYNYDGGPCYRCLYPKPPPPETVTNCSDGGVLGVGKKYIDSLILISCVCEGGGMVFNSTFNNISVMSILLYPEKTTNLPQVTDNFVT